MFGIRRLADSVFEACWPFKAFYMTVIPPSPVPLDQWKFTKIHFDMRNRNTNTNNNKQPSDCLITVSLQLHIVWKYSLLQRTYKEGSVPVQITEEKTELEPRRCAVCQSPDCKQTGKYDFPIILWISMTARVKCEFRRKVRRKWWRRRGPSLSPLSPAAFTGVSHLQTHNRKMLLA